MVDEKGRRNSKISRDQLVTSTTWTLYQLALHPEIVRRLRVETISIFGSDPSPTLQDLDKMNLLKNVICETMPLNPSVGFNIREALTDATLPRGGKRWLGRYCPSERRRFMSLLGMYRNPDSIGPDTDKWRPDRWVPGLRRRESSSPSASAHVYAWVRHSASSRWSM
ncbi:hypothetical protein ASPWEDRAFT_176045 [Aspergillus wentii DTO 134E9]|uniref:Cytochrome P450 n=1 Tax=Aspergillus wentii DTO 134E9 TaxID=1073089 RepID=A0A1L9R7P8_ASPWE|nr:uncharacterized protein ASPWEDRAFT_176045 [Aspergillus wentii DTO 134E9]KAI9927563.1 hypothetical protein MW887_003181 [Aspergillus wentii]OJJ30939.1 hypothetical protein ASPWEDRAFT_176045 [Aspergillus wentii DTO 134E9]